MVISSARSELLCWKVLVFATFLLKWSSLEPWSLSRVYKFIIINLVSTNRIKAHLAKPPLVNTIY